VDLFQRLKVGVASGCLRETSIFKIIITDDVILWSKLEYTWLSLLDFINFISYMDDIQYVSALTVGGKVIF